MLVLSYFPQIVFQSLSKILYDLSLEVESVINGKEEGQI